MQYCFKLFTGREVQNNAQQGKLGVTNFLRRNKSTSARPGAKRHIASCAIPFEFLHTTREDS